MDHDRVLRCGEGLPPLRQLAAALGEEGVAGRKRPRDELLLGVEEVPLRGLALLRVGLYAREQPVQRRRRHREPLDVDRGRDEIGLEVVELELRRLPDDRERLVGVVDARELDHDLVRALLRDDRLVDAELVDPLLHDVHGAVELGRAELHAGRRMCLQDHLEAALQVEALADRLVDRRAGDPHRDHERKRGQDQAEQDQM